ncbi:MAG: hypothetical protein ACC707_20230 [Thiohalomonadales bacterium]
MASQTTMNIINTQIRNYFFATLFFAILVAMLSACGTDDETAPPNFKVKSSPSQFSTSILNALKSAISRNNKPEGYAAYHQLNSYLRDYEFTKLDGSISIPIEKKTTSCSGPKLNLQGSMSREGNNQQGLLTFVDFCIDVSDKQKNKSLLVVNGTTKYTIDMTSDLLDSSVTLDYNVMTSLGGEKQLYFGKVNIPLFSTEEAKRVEKYSEAQTTYNTDALTVSGNLERGYDIRGNITIGNLGRVHVQTSQPIQYGNECPDRPTGGKIDIATNQFKYILEPLDSLCQIEVCAAASGDILMDCSTY